MLRRQASGSKKNFFGPVVVRVRMKQESETALMTGMGIVSAVIIGGMLMQVFYTLWQGLPENPEFLANEVAIIGGILMWPTFYLVGKGYIALERKVQEWI